MVTIELGHGEIVTSKYEYGTNCLKMSKKTAERLKEKLEEALKPRYILQSIGDSYFVLDTTQKNNDDGRPVVVINKIVPHGRSEAERLCERMNREC